MRKELGIRGVENIAILPVVSEVEAQIILRRGSQRINNGLTKDVIIADRSNKVIHGKRKFVAPAETTREKAKQMRGQTPEKRRIRRGSRCGSMEHEHGSCGSARCKMKRDIKTSVRSRQDQPSLRVISRASRSKAKAA